MGDLKAARAEFRKVVTIYEERFFGSEWVVTPGCALAQLGDLEGARAMLRLIEENFNEELESDRSARERLLGEIALANGNSNEALEHFELALTIGSAPLLEEAAGRASDAMGLPEDALTHFKIINAEVVLGWETQEPWMDSHYSLGKIHLDQNRPAQALEYFDRLLEIWQDADDSLPLLQQLRDRRAEAQAQLGG